MVVETIQSYYSTLFSPDLSDSFKELGSPKDPFSTLHKTWVYKVTRQGLGTEILAELQSACGLTKQELIQTISHSGKVGNRLDPLIAEHILGIADVYLKGYEVFDTREDFQKWMSTPIPIFELQTPKSLLSSKYGIDLIINELGRIEHGLFA
ncbi:MAG: MbcA/ParS/Xre antitoxin family protein [Bacteroidota bacterium]